MQSSDIINADFKGAEGFQFLQDRQSQSLGSPFWQKHEEATKLREWVRTVVAIHNWRDEENEHHCRFTQKYNRDVENFHLAENYFHEKFRGLYTYLDAMGITGGTNHGDIVRIVQAELKQNH